LLILYVLQKLHITEKIKIYVDWEKSDEAIEIAEHASRQLPNDEEQILNLLINLCRKFGDKSKQKEYDARRKEKTKEYNLRPEVIAKRKEYYKKYNSRPENKAKAKQLLKKRSEKT
jgi:hypothetical protein